MVRAIIITPGVSISLYLIYLSPSRTSVLEFSVARHHQGDPASLVEAVQYDHQNYRYRHAEEHPRQSPDCAPEDQGNDDYQRADVERFTHHSRVKQIAYY